MNKYKAIRDISIQDIEPEDKEDGVRLAKRVLMVGTSKFLAATVLGLIIWQITR